MSDEVQDHIIFKPLSDRRARDVARALRQLGYSITKNECYGRCPRDIVWKLEPLEERADARLQTILAVCQAAKFTPAQAQITSSTIAWVLSITPIPIVLEEFAKWYDSCT